jgi:predicted Zn-dependent protease
MNSPFFLFRRTAGGFCVAAALSLVVPAHAAKEPSPTTPGQTKSYAYSWEQELKLGAEADKEITEKMGLYDNPQVQAYVESVGQRVLQASTFHDPATPEMYRNTKFTFRVIDSPVVNAFALPGGYVYVTRGLLTHVQNEAQLAFVLGHEIAHVAARHASQQARRSQWTQLGVIAGAILGQKVLGETAPDIAPTLLELGGQAAELFGLRYSREAEHESDNLGVTYAAKAGYAAGESARFFDSLKRISALEGKGLPTWQSSHPDPGDRAKRVQQIAATANPAASAAGKEGAPAQMIGEEEYLKRIDGMIVGEDPREGFTQNGVFYHPTLRFQFQPAPGWTLNNQRAAVVFADPNGRALMGLRVAPGARARDAVAEFVQQSKVQVTNTGETVVNGLPTTVVIGRAQTKEGEMGVWHAFIEMDNRVYSLLGYSPAAAFEQVRSTFESVAATFSPLRDPQLASVQPARLKLVRVDRSAAFASFVPTSLPPNVNAEAIAIMNQVTLNDQVPEGRMLKVPDAPTIPVVANIPVTNAPSSNDPYSRSPQSSYPPPQANPNYPGSPYPPRPSSAPQTYPPSTSYPGGNPPPSTYPSQQPESTSYPPAQTYPPQTTYPPADYPPSQSYPPAQTYPPPSPPNYPPSSPSTYPPSSQYPQSGYPTAGQPQQPTFPSTYPPSQGGAPQTQPGTTYPPPSTYPSQPAPQSPPQQNRGPVWPR